MFTGETQPAHCMLHTIGRSNLCVGLLLCKALCSFFANSHWHTSTFGVFCSAERKLSFTDLVNSRNCGKVTSESHILNFSPSLFFELQSILQRYYYERGVLNYTWSWCKLDQNWKTVVNLNSKFCLCRLTWSLIYVMVALQVLVAGARVITLDTLIHLHL